MNIQKLLWMLKIHIHKYEQIMIICNWIMNIQNSFVFMNICIWILNIRNLFSNIRISPEYSFCRSHMHHRKFGDVLSSEI